MEVEVPFSLEGERVDRAVALLVELPRSVVASMVADGSVFIDGKAVKKVSERVSEGNVLSFEVPSLEVEVPQAESDVPFEVLYSDDDVIVVDKPAGVIVHPGAGNDTGTLVHGLLSRFPDLRETVPGGDKMRPGIVHRLDAGTSGLMVVARSHVAYDQFVADLKARTVERRYLTLVWGAVEPEVGMIDAPIGRSESDRTKMAVTARGRAARTRYQVLQRHVDPVLSWVGAKLETGRTHQIRVHFSALGHPVVGDRRYGGARQGLEMHRPFLHARSLRFIHPVTGEELAFTSSLPEDLQAILAQLDMSDQIPDRELLEQAFADLPENDEAGIDYDRVEEFVIGEDDDWDAEPDEEVEK